MLEYTNEELQAKNVVLHFINLSKNNAHRKRIRILQRAIFIHNRSNRINKKGGVYFALKMITLHHSANRLLILNLVLTYSGSMRNALYV